MTQNLVFNFTGTAIEKLPIPEKGYTTFKDTKNPDLRLYVTAKGVKTFFVRKRVLNRDERVIIGSYPLKTVELARTEAKTLSGLIESGKDPIAEERNTKISNLTFGEHFKEYMDRYSKKHKDTWREDERDVNKHLKHWFKHRLSEIKKSDIQRLHERLYEESGLYQANKILMRIRAIYNKAIEWGWEGKNPTLGIKMYKEQSRDRFILPVEMPFLIQAINEEKNKTIADFLYTLLLTGARRTNTQMMKWEEIDWQNSHWKIPTTKNGDSLTVPLVERAIEILKARSDASKSVWVFENDTDMEAHIPIHKIKLAWTRIRTRATILRWLADDLLAAMVMNENTGFETLTCMAQLKIIAASAKKEKILLPSSLMEIHLHDMRRTFGSYQAITGSSIHIIGKSLGHKSSQVTEVYARLNIDPIRASIERATQAMFDSEFR